MNDELVQVSKKKFLIFAIALGLVVKELKKARKDLTDTQEVIAAKCLILLKIFLME